MTRLLLVFFVFASAHSSAQKIYGTVFNAKGDLLPYASITIKGTSVGASANNSAKFSFAVAPGTYTVVCQHIGFTRQEKTVVIDKLDEIQTAQKQITDDLIQFKPILLKLQDKDEKEISLNYATYLSFISKKIDELSKSSSLKKLEFIVDNSNKIVKFATLKLGLIVAIGVIVLQALSMYKT